MKVECRYCGADTKQEINDTFVNYKCKGCEREWNRWGQKVVKQAKEVKG